MSAGRMGATSAAQLARVFDLSFATARAEVAAPPEHFLAVTLDGRPHALRLSEIEGLHPLGAMTLLPTPVAELCGIIGLRGAILPVYDLAALLGLALARSPRWFVVARDASVALAIERFDGHFPAAPEAVIPTENAGANPIRSVIRSQDVARPLIHLPSVVAAIRSRSTADHPHRSP